MFLAMCWQILYIMGFWDSFNRGFLAFFICSFGLQKGLERVTKIMMGALLVLILVLALHSLTLDKAAEGMEILLDA